MCVVEVHFGHVRHAIAREVNYREQKKVRSQRHEIEKKQQNYGFETHDFMFVIFLCVCIQFNLNQGRFNNNM